MSGLNPCDAAGLEEFGQALVFEASNHSLNVPCNVSGVKTHNEAVEKPFSEHNPQPLCYFSPAAINWLTFDHLMATPQHY
ncbi:MAG: hypothetical protein MH208_07575 [Marinobacter sp.]|nr:hypothetical protein [Marinobacter sp.]